MRSRLFGAYMAAAMLSCVGSNQSSAQSSQMKDDLGQPLGAAKEIRTVVTFRIPDETAQKLLPAGWTVAPFQQGPAKGANLSVVFAERMTTLDADGKAVGGEEPTVILSMPSRKGQETASAILDGFTDAQATPGFYRVFRAAKVSLERHARAANLSSSVEETWTVAADSGEQISFHVAYEQTAPTRMQLVSRNVSAADGRIRRTYRIDQGMNVIQSVPDGVKRSTDLSFKAAGGKLDAIFDGKQEMISVVSLPWYAREMFLPSAMD